MTTIHTIEDLMRILDEHPQWLEAMRARLLTRELIELPQRFAEFASSTNARFDNHEKRLDGLDKRFDGVDKRFDRVESRLGGLERDIAPLKGAHASNVAIRQAALIADEMGLTLTRILTPEDLIAMTRSQDLSDLPKNEVASFRRADLIMETIDEAGLQCYVPVEASYTVNGRDTTRAIRNARLLTRFTGQSARAAVAGMRIDNRVRGRVAAGEVYWYEVDAASMDAE